MKFQHSLSLVIFTIFASVLSAQYAESIRSGRAGLAIGPYTVGKGILQNQSGFYNTNQIKESIPREEIKGNYFISVFRQGITEHFELGAALSYAEYSNQINLDTDSLLKQEKKGVNIFTLAMRSNVSEGKGLIPAFGYQINLSMPWVAKQFRANEIAPRITLITKQSFEKFRFITNWAGIWSGNNAVPSGLYVLFLDRGFGKKWRIYIEHYGLVKENDVNFKFDGGLLYLVNKDIQLDLQYGKGPEQNGLSDAFFSIGFAWRARLIKRP